MVLCKHCKRKRNDLCWRDWQKHLVMCEKKFSGVRKITSFVKPKKPTSPSLGATGTPSPTPSSSSPQKEAVGVTDSDADNLPKDSSCSIDGVGGTFELPLEVELHIPTSDSGEGMASVSFDGSELVLGGISGEACAGAAISVSQSFSSQPKSAAPPPAEVTSNSSMDTGNGCGSSGTNRDISDEDEEEDAACNSKSFVDPATYCKISTFSEAMVNRIIRQGPNQPLQEELKNGKFPVTNERSFKSCHYYQTLTDGKTRQKRHWLSYSELEDRVYCVDCILFAKESQKVKNPAFTKQGFRNWSHAPAAFIIHETSEVHVEASLAANLRKLSLPLNVHLKQEALQKRAENKEIVRQLIDVTLYLARHCLAFRGHREGTQEKLRGNFHDLVAMIAVYSPCMATYLERIKKSAKKAKKIRNFLSWRRQNQYIQAIAAFIKNKIKQELKNALFFSVSLDETFDLSRKEQCSCIIRYVCPKTGKVVERIVALKVSASTTGEQLFKVLLDIFSELDLDWKTYLVGQSYDGASNMRGAYSGLQSLVREEAGSALYVWCWAHRLNLAVKDCVASCVDASCMYNNIRALNNLVNGSKVYVDFFERSVKEHYPGRQVLRLKRVDTTRWNSHNFSLSTVVDVFDAVVDTLVFIEGNGSTGDAKATAQGLLDYFLTEKFVLVSQTFLSMFDEITPLSRSLQAIDVDLMAATNHVNHVLKNLTALRSDEGFTALLKKKDDFISRHEELTFAPLPSSQARRVRRVRRRDGENAADDPITNPLQKIRVEMYFGALDSIINLISERFSDRAQGVYRDLGLFTRQRINEIQENPSKFPKDAFAAFCKLFGKFVAVDDLRREYLQFVKVFSEYEAAMSLPDFLHDDAEWIDLDSGWEETGDDENDDGAVAPENEEIDEIVDSVDEANDNANAETNFKYSASMAKILEITHKTGLREIFPTLYVALRIAVTLPVSSASTERSFSKLKIIKNRLRTTMQQSRLEDLLIISCENDIEVEKEEVLMIFANFSTYLTAQLL